MSAALAPAQTFCCPRCQAGWQRQPLTSRQREVYDYIAESIRTRGYAPTYTEISSRFAFAALSTVAEHITNLERKGWIARRFKESRGIVLVEVPS